MSFKMVFCILGTLSQLFHRYFGLASQLESLHITAKLFKSTSNNIILKISWYVSMFNVDTEL